MNVDGRCEFDRAESCGRNTMPPQRSRQQSNRVRVSREMGLEFCVVAWQGFGLGTRKYFGKWVWVAAQLAVIGGTAFLGE